MEQEERQHAIAVRTVSRIKPRTLSVLLVLVWSGGSWATVVTLAYGFLTDTRRDTELVLALLGSLIAAIMSTSWLIWQWRGREIIEITDEGLCMWHEPALFERRLFLRLDEVEYIRAEEDTSTPWWIRERWALGGGGGAIGHNGRKRRWGIDLDAMQAEELAGKIRRDLEERLAVLK
jgi:hypothetical protein